MCIVRLLFYGRPLFFIIHIHEINQRKVFQQFKFRLVKKMTDLSTVPLVALSMETKQLISTLLNPTRCLPTESGLPRDWRGLAHFSGLSSDMMPALRSHSDPSEHILSIMQKKSKDFTIKDLQIILERLKRWDIVDDTEKLFENDAERFLKSLTSAEVIENDIDMQMLTMDDIYRHEQGVEKQHYDAFLLYADEDTTFAEEMIENLENKYNLKLCLKDRDLIGGVTFEHKAVMQLISERCNKLIVIISPNFLKSPVNTFFLDYAQALGIHKRERKVIPCLYKKCELPRQLSYMFILDYTKVGLYDFWRRLRYSIQSRPTIKNEPKESIAILSESQSTKSVEKSCCTNNVSDAKLDQCTQCKQNDYSEAIPCPVPENIQSTEHENIVKNCLGNTENSFITKKKSRNLFHYARNNWKYKVKTKNKYKSDTEMVTAQNLPSLDTLTTSLPNIVNKEQKKKKTIVNTLIKNVL